LSAIAVERHAGPVLEAMLPLLEGWAVGRVVIAEQARVAIGDEIGEVLGAAATLLLIGERPGLSSPDSMGAYITWAPRLGRSDAERNCVSNIRPEGLGYSTAAGKIAGYLAQARRLQLTGVALKEEASEIGTRGTPLPPPKL
jgi:ethanolamine ammonia-lyase small subunit